MKAYYSPKTDLAVNIFNALLKSGDIELLPPDKDSFAEYAKKEMDDICEQIEESFPSVKGYTVMGGIPYTTYTGSGPQVKIKKVNKHNKRDSKGRFKKTENWCEFVYLKRDLPVYEKELKEIRIQGEDDEYIWGWYRNDEAEFRTFRKDRIIGEINRWQE